MWKNIFIKCKVITTFQFYQDYFDIWKDLQKISPILSILKIKIKQYLLIVNAFNLMFYVFYQSKLSPMINLITCNLIYLNNLHSYINAWLMFTSLFSYVCIDLLYFKNFNISGLLMYQLLIKQNNNACFIWPYIYSPKKVFAKKRANPSYQPKTIAKNIKKLAISLRSQYQILYFCSGKKLIFLIMLL